MRALVPYLAYFYITLVGLTTRLKVVGQEKRDALRGEKQRFIYAFWHQRQVYLTWTHRGDRTKVMVSRSKDGELIAETMRLSRMHSCRGSSSRGGMAAVREMLDARTIGYWKNWSSCTGGKQFIKAGERNELNKTLDFYLPLGVLPNSIYPFGDIPGPLSCTQAVRLLSKSDMNSGKKMASDPAYNLAAQLLAAKLNLAATGACPDAVTAINAAQALLDAIGFTGTGSYKNMSAANATLANSLAETLDDFNNNVLCPAP